MIKTETDDCTQMSTAHKLHLKYNDKQRLKVSRQIDFRLYVYIIKRTIIEI